MFKYLCLNVDRNMTNRSFPKLSFLLLLAKMSYRGLFCLTLNLSAVSNKIGVNMLHG